jgi:hypothetical protein
MNLFSRYDLPGCPAFQGHLFGEAIPVEQFEALLDKNRNGGCGFNWSFIKEI